MHIRAHLLEPLFVLHPEMLFLINDQQTKVLKPNVFGQERMGANDHIDGPFGHPLPSCVGVLRGHKPRQGSHVHGEPTEPFREVLVVLSRQQGGRRNDRHLHAGQRGDKGRADGHLRLAETDIAANQAIHRATRAHVVQDILNRLKLIVGLHIREPRKELIPKPVHWLHHRGCAQLPLRRDTDQTFRNLADAFFQLGFLGLPRTAAKTIQETRVMAVL